MRALASTSTSPIRVRGYIYVRLFAGPANKTIAIKSRNKTKQYEKKNIELNALNQYKFNIIVFGHLIH